MIKGCIFDLDGTLVNTLEDLADATNAALVHYGYPKHSYHDYRMILGNGVTKQIQRAMSPHHEKFPEVLNYYRNYYERHCFDKSRPYEGIPKLLQDLAERKIKLCCLTNKPQDFAEAILARLFPNIKFLIYGGTPDRPLKPDPTSTIMALSDMKLTPDECLFIGDTYVDMETGHHARMRTIGCLWGFRDYQELSQAHADVIVNKPSEIKELIDACNQSMPDR